MKTNYVYDEYGVSFRVVNASEWSARLARASVLGVVGGLGEVYNSEAYSAMIRSAFADGVVVAE